LSSVPFAPGIKTVLLFPLYVVASQMTWSRWGATVVGATVGLLGFLQGDGRFGVLEILKHLAPGLVIDRRWSFAPLYRRADWGTSSVRGTKATPGEAMWFDGQADAFDDTAGLAPGVGQAVARAVLELGRWGNADALLDIGAGTGAVGAHFTEPSLRYLGCDRSLGMLQVFRRKMGPLPRHMLLLQVEGDRPWPIRDRALAVIFASRVVHHLSLAHFVREVWRVCRPGGCLLLGRVTRAAESLPSRLQRHKRALLAEHGVRAGGGGQATQQLVAVCCEQGATPLAPTSVAMWTRTTSARQLLAGWEGKPQLVSGSPGRPLDPEARMAILQALTDRARQEVGDLDRLELFTEEYTLQGVRLP
jgi:SAM-dependent methyltransferase